MSDTAVLLDGPTEPLPDVEPQEAYMARMEQEFKEFQAALRTTVHTLGAKRYVFVVGKCEVMAGQGVQGQLDDGTLLTIPWHAIQRIVSIDTRPLVNDANPES